MPKHRTGDQVPDRSGTAWERSDRYLHGFIITLCLVTFFPKQALKEMRLILRRIYRFIRHMAKYSLAVDLVLRVRW